MLYLVQPNLIFVTICIGLRPSHIFNLHHLCHLYHLLFYQHYSINKIHHHILHISLMSTLLFLITSYSKKIKIINIAETSQQLRNPFTRRSSYHKSMQHTPLAAEVVVVVWWSWWKLIKKLSTNFYL